jgi:hypothetical protein
MMKVLRALVGGASLLIGAATFVAQAQAFELTGIWATDAAQCGKIFTKKGAEVAFAPMSDFYGDGFIIEGDRIRAKIARCTIKSRTQDGATIRLSATCASEVAVETAQFSLKVIDDNTIARIYPGDAAMDVNFHRCTL